MKEIDIGGIGNHLGGLSVKVEDNKFYWGIENWLGTSWEEIPQTLYDELNSYQDNKDTQPQANQQEGANNELLVRVIPPNEYVKKYFQAPPRYIDYHGWPWKVESGIYKTQNGKYIRKEH